MVSRLFGLIITLTLVPAAIAAAQSIVPPSVPAGLEPPSEVQPFLMAHAEGTQNYTCLSSSSGFTWSFFGPQATLFDEANQQVITHYLSPNPVEGGTPRATWQHSADTSAIWAAAIASSTDPAYVASGAIPWLLLQVKGSDTGPTAGATLVGTLFIQRVNTQGGLAPATGCKSAKDVGKKALVPYSTDYVFYR